MDYLIRKFWDRFDTALAPLMRFVCVKFNRHSGWCRGAIHCRIGRGST